MKRYLLLGFYFLVSIAAIGTVAMVRFSFTSSLGRSVATTRQVGAKPRPVLQYQRRSVLDTSGFGVVGPYIKPWDPNASLDVIRDAVKGMGYRMAESIDKALQGNHSGGEKISFLVTKAIAMHFEAEPGAAYTTLEQARKIAESDDSLAEAYIYTIIYFQGVTALRLGENENCIMCRGDSSCILPIVPSAVHQNPRGSRLAIEHFTEYLQQFPDDREVCWLLNLAHMTLGEHPDKVDPKFVISLDHYLKSEFDIGRFRDVGHLVGVNRFNQAGGAVMDDFDNDGLLDLAVTTWDATESMVLFHNQGDGTFEDRTEQAGLTKQYGGLYCVQADYNNDGHLDLYIPRGAWIPLAVRPTLLRNNGDGTFADVTKESGLLDPVNSNSASWADYDNDGFLDLFVCCERQRNRLFHNNGDGTFAEVAVKAGLVSTPFDFCKGAAWIDYDNDRYPDLFVSNLSTTGQLYHNNRDGSFTDVTSAMGIDGPQGGFSCWAWDYDNDGWLDIFATCYNRTLGEVVKGLLGQPHEMRSNRLFRNMGGNRFVDVNKDAGLDMVFSTMGSNYGDFDNDGFLDMYLATGEPNLATLIPNRMLKNVDGKRFAEITGTSGTGHLQKGHAVACGDWDRDGDVDIFAEMGGAVRGDKFHDVLFQNPGQGHHWLTVKLVGQKSNRSAIGARVRVTTAGATPMTIHRHISSGSSFGANPLQQTIGLAKAHKVATLEVYWPTSDTTQVFHDIPADRAIEITEFAKDFKTLDWKPVPAPH